MKRTMIILGILAFLLAGCNGKGGESRNNGKTGSDTLAQVQPVVHIRVKKIYDDQGNLIGKDSVYVWSFSNVRGDTLSVLPDSLMHMFMPFTLHNFPDSLQGLMSSFFHEDSLFYRDFFNEDYFFDRFNKDLGPMTDILRQMDSLKKSFLKEYFPSVL